MLKKRVRRADKEEVVAELMSFLFTPDVIHHFNVTGTHAKKDTFPRKAFNNLRINQIIKGILTSCKFLMVL